MMLINSLMAHASDPRWDEFIAELERLNVRKAVIVRIAVSSCLVCSLHTPSLTNHVFRCRLAEADVVPYDRGSDVVHPGLPSEHGPSNVPEEDDAY